MQFEHAKVILKHLRGNGIKCVIAGGYARDLFLGVEPKDVDIVCFGYVDRDEAVELGCSIVFGDRMAKQDQLDRAETWDSATVLRNAVYSLCYDFKKSTDDFWVESTFSIYHSKIGSGDQMVEGHKFNCGVDVLVYEPCDSVFEALQMFDYNLSQFALIGEEFIPEYLGMDSLSELVKTRLDMDDRRVAYVEEKYKQLKPLIDEAIEQGRLF